MYPSRDIGLKWVNVTSDSGADESSMICKQVVTEVDVRRCSVKKKVFLKILQNSQENTCAIVFFNKVADLNTLFYRTPLVAASIVTSSKLTIKTID